MNFRGLLQSDKWIKWAICRASSDQMSRLAGRTWLLLRHDRFRAIAHSRGQLLSLGLI